MGNSTVVNEALFSSRSGGSKEQVTLASGSVCRGPGFQCLRCLAVTVGITFQIKPVRSESGFFSSLDSFGFNEVSQGRCDLTTGFLNALSLSSSSD